MYLEHCNHDPHYQLPTDRIRAINITDWIVNPGTHRIYLKIHTFWIRWTETLSAYRFLLKIKRRDLKWWSSWTPRPNWIRAITVLGRAELIMTWPIHAISQSMVSPTNIHFRNVSSETGQYEYLTTEFRFMELVSGYSSREDSMDCMSIVIILAAASMISGFVTKVFITN